MSQSPTDLSSLETWVVNKSRDLGIRAASLKAVNLKSGDTFQPGFLLEAGIELEKLRSQMDLLLGLIEEVLLPISPSGSVQAMDAFTVEHASFYSLSTDQQNRFNRLYRQANPPQAY